MSRKWQAVEGAVLAIIGIIVIVVSVRDHQQRETDHRNTVNAARVQDAKARQRDATIQVLQAQVRSLGEKPLVTTPPPSGIGAAKLTLIPGPRGPAGKAGADGKDGDTITGPAGPQGPPGESVKGDPGSSISDVSCSSDTPTAFTFTFDDKTITVTCTAPSPQDGP